MPNQVENLSLTNTYKPESPIERGFSYSFGKYLSHFFLFLSYGSGFIFPSVSNGEVNHR